MAFNSRSVELLIRALNCDGLFCLQYCAQKNPSQFRSLINSSSGRELKAICELILNILHGRLKVSNISKLKKYRINYRHLTNPQLTSSARKRYIKRGKGFLTPLLGLALPALISLFKK